MNFILKEQKYGFPKRKYYGIPLEQPQFSMTIMPCDRDEFVLTSYLEMLLERVVLQMEIGNHVHAAGCFINVVNGIKCKE